MKMFRLEAAHQRGWELCPAVNFSLQAGHAIVPQTSCRSYEETTIASVQRTAETPAVLCRRPPSPSDLCWCAVVSAATWNQPYEQLEVVQIKIHRRSLQMVGVFSCCSKIAGRPRCSKSTADPDLRRIPIVPHPVPYHDPALRTCGVAPSVGELGGGGDREVSSALGYLAGHVVVDDRARALGGAVEVGIGARTQILPVTTVERACPFSCL